MKFLKSLQILDSFKKHPQFVLMRGIARFKLVRSLVRALRHYSQRRRWKSYKAELKGRLHESLFKEIDHKDFTARLKRDGVAFGLTLPDEMVAALRTYADHATCYADRESDKGFSLENKSSAEHVLGKPILVAQYLNTEQECPEIAILRNDPFFLLVAAEYLGSIPTHVGTNLWWTFPVQASLADRARHAQVFHWDLDDFAFCKFFFYLTDVTRGDGAHVCIPGSHLQPPIVHFADRFKVRRWSDEEITHLYGNDRILEIVGCCGVGFAEDTLCLHKGTTPTVQPRLLLQFQFALFDHGVQRDEVSLSCLRRIA